MISHDQEAADQRVLLNGVNRSTDEDRAVVEDRQRDARHLAVDAIDFGAHGVAIATVFVPDCLVMRSRTPALPLMRVNERKSSVESLTSAMSRM